MRQIPSMEERNKAMSLSDKKPRGSFGRASMEEAWEYRLILGVSFVLCLAYAIMARLIPGQRTRTAGGHDTPGTSILSEARSAAYAAAGYACQR